MSTPRVTVIVHSFNRPRMLREALMSVAAGRPDQVIVADDGSDGVWLPTVVGNALYQRVEYALICNEPIPVDERMTARRQGELINRAITHATGDIITTLCDDDLHAPGWYDALRAHWAEHPQQELVRGTWLQFNDGDAHSEADPPCPLDGRQMTAGNFAWHASLTGERGASWPTDQTSCLDNGFLWSLHQRGVNQFAAPLVGLAGWRREHPKAGVHHSTGRDHAESLRALLAAGYLE